MALLINRVRKQVFIMQSNRSTATRLSRMSRVLARGRHMIFSVHPARLLAFGYLGYMLVGWALLSLPMSKAADIRALDTLFTAVSAVSTTGLTTIDTGSSFTLFGEIIVLLLIQFGGLGYMTVSSFAFLALAGRISGARKHAVRATFGLPDGTSIPRFLASSVIFTAVVEAAGAFALWLSFRKAGVDDAAWQATFHSISAFCTAGFSLFSTGLTDFSADRSINWIVSVLSILGAMGFLVVADVISWFRSERSKTAFTSAVIIWTTFGMIIGVMFLIAFTDPLLAALPPAEVWRAAFFQAMSASTTVGFNTIDVSAIAPLTGLLLIILMIVGASPAGTGGGLKTTSFAALIALFISVARGRPNTQIAGRRLPDARVRLAAATLIAYLVLLLAALVLLMVYDPQMPFLPLVFEAVSALSTVGLSMGLTGGFSEPGKVVLIALMYAGRVGILTFVVAVAARIRVEKPTEADLAL